MSELIDKIFDVDKISSEVSTILTELAKVNSAMVGFVDNIKKVEAETRKSKGTEELANSSKKLNDEFTKAQKPLKDSATLIAELQAKTEQLTTSEKAASIEIAKARLELSAAKKATKEAAIAKIELTANNGKLSTSYNALQKDLTKSQKAFKDLEKEEQNSAKGQELLKKIQDLQKTLKTTDASMGNYQRNVGNYGSALEGLTPKIGGLAGTLLDIARAAKKSRDDLNEMGGDNGLGVVANPRIPAGLATIMTGVKGVGQSALAMGKAFLANPIGVVIIAVAGAFALVNAAIKSNGQATEKLGQVMAPFKMMLGLVLNVVGQMVSTFLDGVLAFAKFGNAVMSVIPGLDKLAAKNNEAINLEKEKQRLIRAGIVDKATDAKEELRIAELKKQIMQKDKFSAAERLAMAKDIDKSEKAMAKDDANRAAKKLADFLADMKQKRKWQKDYTIPELEELAELDAKVSAEKQVYFDRTKKLASRESALIAEIAAEKKAEADAQIASNEKVIAARRRLVDSGLEIMKDGKEKELAISAEKFTRQIEDEKATGKLKENILTAQKNEAKKINDEWDKKEIDAKKKTADELLAIEVKRMEEVHKGIEKQTEKLNEEFDKKALLLKKEYSLTEQTAADKEKLDKDLAKLQLDNLLEVNNATIMALEKELEAANLSDDKKTELSNKLTKLKIANENAVVDATIKANDAQVKAEEDAAKKREEITKALADLAGQIFSEISNYAIAQSEEKIAGYEKEQEAANLAFEKQQENLDNAIMSDETRAQKQKEINEAKAANDKIIADKIKAEKIKQAKWDKANAIIQAIIQTSLAVASALKTLNPALAVIAGIAGAIQIASIAAQPIPAFEKGGITGDGLALWGEKRAEIAVTPSGQTFIADKPTVSNFDAGTKIYKSVADYEAAMAKNSHSDFKIEYDKMPQNNIVLDGSGLWSIVNKQNARRTMINRRYKN